MRHDVIRMAVATVLVISHEHLRTKLTNDIGGLLHGGGEGRRVGCAMPECTRIIIARGAHHAAIAPASGAAEEAVIAYPEGLHRAVKFGQSIPPELVGAIGREAGEFGHQDLTQFTQRAGEQRDVGTARGITRHSGSGADRFVIRMSVDQQKAMISDAHVEKAYVRVAWLSR